MIKASFIGNYKRDKDLTELIHFAVCGPFRSTMRQGERYFVPFVDHYSRYVNFYLTKHNSITFEVFKIFHQEEYNQLGKNIKILWSNRCGEYLIDEFYDHHRNCGIVSQLALPRKTRNNGVPERINLILLYMVWSMMNCAKLPISFWGCSKETDAYFVNHVPTKKVLKIRS